jgi:hypothetical protein
MCRLSLANYRLSVAVRVDEHKLRPVGVDRRRCGAGGFGIGKMLEQYAAKIIESIFMSAQDGFHVRLPAENGMLCATNEQPRKFHTHRRRHDLDQVERRSLGVVERDLRRKLRHDRKRRLRASFQRGSHVVTVTVAWPCAIRVAVCAPVAYCARTERWARTRIRTRFAPCGRCVRTS